MEPTRVHNWDDSIENSVKYIGESCQAYKMMHLLSAKQFGMLYNILMYISLILSPVAGTLATIGSILDQPSIPFNIAIAIITYLTGIITAAVKFGEFHEKSESHKIATSKYTSLESNIRRQLQLYRDDRIAANEYYEWVSKSFDDIFGGAPFINDHIYQKYYKMSVEKGLVFPNRYDHFIAVENGFQEKMMHDLSNKEEISVTAQESPPNTHREDVHIDVDASPTGSNSQSFGSFKANPGRNYHVFPRRKSVNTPISELNRYGDEQMNYELKRFMGF